MNSLKIAGGWLLCLAGLAFGAQAPVASNGVELTAEEQAFLAEHPVIRVGVAADWPPLDFLNRAGEPDGIGADFLKEMNPLLGGVLQIQAGAPDENLQKMQAGELDVILDCGPDPDRAAGLDFTQSYLEIPHVIVGKRGGRFYTTAK